MKRNLRKYLIVFLFMLFAGSFVTARPCFAASAEVNLSADNNEVVVGDMLFVYIKINSETTFSDFEANLVYDKNILLFNGGASVITGGNGYLRISDMGNGQVDNSRKYALEFKALKVGKCDLFFDGQVMVYDDSGNEMSVSNDALTVTVNAQETASKDAYLKSLVTSPGDFTPAFDKEVYEYSINVSSDTAKLVVNAIPENENAHVSIDGNETLAEGENKIIITVLSESGEVIQYTINAFKEAAPSVTVQPTLTSAPAINGSGSEVIQNDLGIYMVCDGKYKITDPDSEVVIPGGYIKSILSVSGITITAYVPSDNPESEFVLIYAENSAGNAGFYQYDRKENTLQRYQVAPIKSDNNNTSGNAAAIVIAILSALSILLIVLVVWLYQRMKRYKKDDF